MAVAASCIINPDPFRLFLSNRCFSSPINRRRALPSRSPLLCCCFPDQVPDDPKVVVDQENKKAKKLSEQSSWESKDSEGKDYLYRLGQESDNMDVAVGARKGVIDDLFVGNFLGKDSDIVFDYRQKATRSFEYLQGDYYIAPVFLDKIGKLLETLLEVYNH